MKLYIGIFIFNFLIVMCVITFILSIYAFTFDALNKTEDPEDPILISIHDEELKLSNLKNNENVHWHNTWVRNSETGEFDRITIISWENVKLNDGRIATLRIPVYISDEILKHLL